MAGTPSLTTLRRFQNATSGGPFRGRDELQLMDRAIAHWHEHAGSATGIQRMAMLQAAIRECQSWLSAKDSKLKTSSTSLVRKRAVAVEAVLQEFQDLYRFEHYRSAKGAGRLDGRGMQMKGLDGSYVFEATSQAKGVAHPSASNVLHYAASKGLSTNSREAYSTARDQYVADPNRGGPTEQLYYTRSERIRYMVLIRGGRLLSDPTSPANVGRGPYAIDEYGNLFAQEVPNVNEAFNHSSFCRGKQVLCAGIIDIYNGKLVYIDNMSGHYKPRPQHLASALRLLMSSGVDISQVEVMCNLGPGSSADRRHCGVHADTANCQAADAHSGHFTKVIFAKGTSFLTNPDGNGLQVVDPKTFTSSADQARWANTPHIEFNHVA